MSIMSKHAKDYGPSKRNFDQDTIFGSFEVIDMGTSCVAINDGVLIIGNSAVHFNKCQFKGDVQPQDLLGAVIDVNKFLSVDKDDFVCLIVHYGVSESSSPEVEIKALTPTELGSEEYKRKSNKIFKLARIRNLVTEKGETFLDIENLYMSRVIAETEHWPSFTPIIWPVEDVLDPTKTPETQGDGSCDKPKPPPKKWRAVFIPGAIYLPQTMMVPAIFELNGMSMLGLPVVDVKFNDTYYLEYVITSKWELGQSENPTTHKKDPPRFFKDDGTEKRIVETYPAGPVCTGENSRYYNNCTEKDGIFYLKVLTFTGPTDGSFIDTTIYWKSDVLIYGWRRCPSDCDTPTGGSSSGSGSTTSEGSTGSTSDTSGSDKSTAIVAVPWEPSGYAALFIKESPDVVFDDCRVKVEITGPITVQEVDPKFLWVCEPNSVLASSVCWGIPVSIGAEVVGGHIIIRVAETTIPTPKYAVVSLNGIRKGFLGKRFSARTRQQYLENEVTLNSAYSNYSD